MHGIIFFILFSLLNAKSIYVIEAETKDPIENVNQLDTKYFDNVIYTDISKDGTLKGVNISQTKKFAKSIQIPIIASGGISNINNVKALQDLRDIGISGVIIGKAIYEKKFDLNNLIKLIGN